MDPFGDGPTFDFAFFAAWKAKLKWTTHTHLHTHIWILILQREHHSFTLKQWMKECIFIPNFPSPFSSNYHLLKAHLNSMKMEKLDLDTHISKIKIF